MNDFQISGWFRQEADMSQREEWMGGRHNPGTLTTYIRKGFSGCVVLIIERKHASQLQAQQKKQKVKSSHLEPQS